jgi:penicillin amidase
LNCLFASKSGDIAIWHQGVFPAKWRRQGDFVMPGTDSTYMWREMIPQEENPHMKNPVRGFVSSANQLPADSTYPYYMGRPSSLYRGYVINRYLDSMQDITIGDMKKMQTDNYSVAAEFARKILLKTNKSRLDADGKRYFEMFSQWDNRKDADSKGATVFHEWWSALRDTIWRDDFKRTTRTLPTPSNFTLIESLLKDTTYSFIDDINTSQKETLQDQLIASLKKATSILKKKEDEDKMEWWKGKDTRVRHLIEIAPFSRFHIPVGGGFDVINAATDVTGPSLRMIVQLTDTIEAYGIYVGGQSGNPGSRYYESFIDDWAAGKYYKLGR